MDISVIVPTCNRPQILAQCLAGLNRQSLSQDRFETLVCDDGSHADLSETVAAAGLKNLRLFRQPRSGPAAARNLGVRHATGELLLFLNDDAIPDSDLLLHHYLTHRGFKDARIAVLGRLASPEHYLNTRFGQILEGANALFGYNGMRRLQAYDYNYFYTCNVSVRASFVAAAGGFDPAFADAAAEDVELGYRLQKQGVAVLYNPDCLTWHEHQIAPSDFCNINYRRGFWAMLFFHKHPDLEKVPRLSDENVAAWTTRLEREESLALDGLTALTAAYLADRAAPDLAVLEALNAELKAMVEILHQHHYLRGLLASPLLGVVMERQRKKARPGVDCTDYKQEQRRSLL